MIIFDLDGTLALCDHRRHFVDPSKHPDYYSFGTHPRRPYRHKETHRRFEPDWDAFYEACDKDQPNKAVIKLFHWLHAAERKVQIWSGRSEKVRQKTVDWLCDHCEIDYCCRFDAEVDLRMRPVGDSTPDDVLKERWLDEALAEGKKIDMVFDDRDKVVATWRRRGITCLQVAEGKF